MRIPSAYKVYQTFFGYRQAELGQRIAFGMAIADTLPVLCDVMESGSFEPIKAYAKRAYPRKLASRFLEWFEGLSTRRDPRFVSRWGYMDAEISLPRTLFPFTKKRGLDIDFHYLRSPDRAEVIVPTFGTSDNMAAEVGVLVALCELGTVRPAFSPKLRVITYWDLLNGTESSVVRTHITAADKQAVLEACSRLLAG